MNVVVAGRFCERRSRLAGDVNARRSMAVYVAVWGASIDECKQAGCCVWSSKKRILKVSRQGRWIGGGSGLLCGGGGRQLSSGPKFPSVILIWFPRSCVIGSMACCCCIATRATWAIT